MMACLIGKYTAIMFPCSPPACGIIIRLIPFPAQANCSHDKFTKPALFQCLMCLNYSRIITVLMYDKEAYPMFITCFNYVVCITEPQCYRFFNYQRFPVLDQ